MKQAMVMARPGQNVLRATLAGMLLAALVALVPVAGFAQETTSTVRGTVTGPNGVPVAGAVVRVTDTRTGSSRTTATSGDGSFRVSSLQVGGPYIINVQSDSYQDAVVTDVYAGLSDTATFAIELGGADQEIEEITVVASKIAVAPLALGPGTSFSLDEINSMPSIQRQIRDVIRIDPRVSLGRASSGSGYGINCLGGAPRSNAITIDGAIASDGFGLNEGTGTSARFAFPVPYDTIQSASVEFAPIDVQYSQFTGCAINIVTRGGTNEFHGSGFYLYNDDGLTGKDIAGEQVITDPFEDKNWGVNFSGPILEDKLFFFLAYEETDEGGIQNTGPIGGGFANEDFLTIDEANQIRDVLINQYGRDPGNIVRNLPQTSERVFARVDWNINDDHRAELTYTDLQELNVGPDDLGFNGFTFSDNFEFEGIEQDTISLRVFSSWTDNLSTEFRYSKFDVLDIQGPVGGGEAQDPNPKPRITLAVGQDPFFDDIFTSGPGFFRSANDLQYEIEQIKLSADYVLGDHTLTVGVEQETRDIFNLFISDATGTINFFGATTQDAIAALQSGVADEITMFGSFTGDPNDAAASFDREINTFYLQDEWQATDALTVIAGLRFDEYASDDQVIFNPVFEQRYGFGNTQTFDGLDLLQPRIGIRWRLPETSLGNTQLSAGFGVFGGGDPTVHFANSYQNFGGAIGFGGSFFQPPCTPADLQVLNGGTFTGVPDCVRQAAADAANANTGFVAAVDPNFELPENHRWNIGINHVLESSIGFLNGWEIQADYIYTDHKNAVDWVDLRLSPNGVTLPDGRPQFFEVDPLLPGCDATFNGIRQGFSNAGTSGGPCDDSGNDNQDTLMTNGVEGSTGSFSLQFAKDFVFSDSTSLNVGIGYANLDAEIGNPVNSSTPGSAYEEAATAVLNHVPLGPAVWANEHNFVVRMNLEHYFFDDHPTRIGLFFQRRSGRPFSYTYEDDTVEGFFGDTDDEERVLLYVPTGPDDSAFDFSQLAPGETDALFQFLQDSGLSQYAGSVVPKNAFESPWSTDLDLRISQEVQLPWAEHTMQVFVDIENFLNLLSDDYNMRQFANTGDIQEGIPVLEVDSGSTGQFVVTDWFDNGLDWQRDVDDSVYRIQLGVRYSF